MEELEADGADEIAQDDVLALLVLLGLRGTLLFLLLDVRRGRRRGVFGGIAQARRDAPDRLGRGLDNTQLISAQHKHIST